MFDLTGKVAIVTGASRGIGRAISEALGRQGALVAMTDVLGDAAVQAAHELVAAGLKAEGYTMDVTSAEDVQATVASIVERHNRVDILVNNAGIVRDMVALRLKREDWDPNGERNPQNRGKSKYVRISWDEAAQLVADEVKRLCDTYGPLSILVQGDGHGEHRAVQ